MTITCKYVSDIDGKTFDNYEAAVDHESTHQVAEDLISQFNLLLNEQELYLIADWVYQTYVKDTR